MSYSELSESCSIAVLANHLEPIVYKYNSLLMGRVSVEQVIPLRNKGRITGIPTIMVVLQYMNSVSSAFEITNFALLLN